MTSYHHQIAVLVPCYNEAVSIRSVVTDFRRELPQAIIYVYDNNSTDGTADIARAAGAVVRNEPLQGKGQVVRRMFSDIDADVYVLVDGDATYDAASAPKLIDTLFEKNLDCVNGVRKDSETEAYRPGHRFGNWLLTTLVAKIFGHQTSDMLTGYRVFSRRFVKSFPSLASGFEIETEMTIHALELRMLVADVETPYRSRPPGSESKLNTFRDGFRIMRTIIAIVKGEKPLLFFGFISFVLFCVAVLIFIPVLLEYLKTGLVPRLPTAILSTGLVISALVSLACGLVLSTVTLGRQEMKRLVYLSHPAPRREAIRDLQLADDKQVAHGTAQ